MTERQRRPNPPAFAVPRASKADLARCLSGADIMAAVPDARIRLWRDVHNCRNIDEFLGQGGKVALLYESQPNFGHWCTVFRTRRGICFADPYGELPDEQILRVDPHMREILTETRPLLFRMMENSGYPYVEYDDVPLQVRRDGINTCGRHAITRLSFSDLPPEEYVDKVFEPVASPADDVVVWATNPVLPRGV